jgi:glycosyltransferase involved in cell wall biosynthesis
MQDKTAANIKQCIIIPVYNHGKTAHDIAAALSCLHIPIILVDDGSNEETKQHLASAASELNNIVLVTREKNGGKGAAVMTGIDTAFELDCTNALQLDADGQHDLSSAAFFLEKSAAAPQAAICGLPQFDASIPKSRLMGRKISVFWASIVTLSSAIPDALCGFRVYPVNLVHNLIHSAWFDKRMGFDVEILVRLYWKRVPLFFYPLKVIYPKGGVSHFHPVGDNARISLVFFRLFFGMIFRLPLLLVRNSGGGGKTS